MASVRLKYKAMISDNIWIIATGWFAFDGDEWQLELSDYIDEVIIQLHGKRHSIDIKHNAALWFDTWDTEVRQLLTEEDAGLLQELNAAAEQQKHEGAV